MKLKSLIGISFIIILAVACKNKPSSDSDIAKRTVFFERSAMDTTVKPGDDFFQYANGAWMKETIIPASETGWGSFYTLYEDNQKNIRQILNKVSEEDNSKGSLEQKVGDLYASGMDTVAIEKLSYQPVKPLLDRISALKNQKELIDLVSKGYNEGDGFLFGLYVGPDDRISSKNVLNFSQAGLGLPNRDYYFNSDSATLNIRKEYLKYIAKLFTITGIKQADADKQAIEILNLETEIAKSHSTPVELRDPIKNYNKFSVSDFQKQVPDIDLRNVFTNLLIKTDTILVGQPKYYQTLSTLLKTQPIDVWKNKLKFKALDNATPSLSKSFRDARFDFYGKTLNGQKQQRERWKAMVSTVDGGLGELLGQLYVKKHFKPEAKERMLKLVNNLQQVYKSRIEKLDWMSPETKKRAIAKLETFIKKIGYADKWENYGDVSIDRGGYYKNLKSIAKHDYKKMIDKLGKPVDKTEWQMTPPTVNAYYNPSFNEIVFPAGILQFPFFDFDADDAINYGAIGAIIGHEMTHGFDDQGRQYDKDGNLNDWWTPADATKFKDKANKVVIQYNNYTVLKGLKVNGSLTQGENLADIGGLAIAYQAFKNTKQGKSDDKIDGFTADQRFFLSFAQVWRIKTRDENMRLRVTTDPHSPEIFRVNGTVVNMPAFYKAFNVMEGDKLFVKEENRAKIW